MLSPPLRWKAAGKPAPPPPRLCVGHVQASPGLNRAEAHGLAVADLGRNPRAGLPAVSKIGT